MLGVLYAAVAVVFVLGLALIVVLGRRTRATSARHGSHEANPPTSAPATVEPSEFERLRAEAEAEAVAIRRAAQADADAARLDAGAQRARAREHADTLLAEAREQVEAQLQRARDDIRARHDDARRHGEDEAARMTAELARAQGASCANTASAATGRGARPSSIR